MPRGFIAKLSGVFCLGLIWDALEVDFPLLCSLITLWKLYVVDQAVTTPSEFKSNDILFLKLVSPNFVCNSLMLDIVLILHIWILLILALMFNRIEIDTKLPIVGDQKWIIWICSFNVPMAPGKTRSIVCSARNFFQFTMPGPAWWQVRIFQYNFLCNS